jgi:hypothetical protein
MPLPIPQVSGMGCSYAGYAFDASLQTTAFDLKQIMSQDGRIVKWVEVSLTVTGYITTGGTGTDPQMLALRKALQTSGLKLVYSNGVGGFIINAPGFPTDVQFGPIPTLIRFKPLGGGNAAKVTWSVMVRLPECPDATQFQGIAEFNWKVSWQLTRALTRRSISGFLVIANNNTTPGSRVTRDSADNYREQIVFPVPNQMHRLAPQTWNLSENRSRLDFSLVDESLPNRNAYPPGVTNAKVSHTVQTGSLFNPIFTATINAEYTFARNVDPRLGWFYFWRLVQYRVSLLSTTGPVNQPITITIPPIGGLPGQTITTTIGQQAKFIVPQGFRMEESDVYDQPRARFSTSYTFSSPRKTVIAASGLWTPVPDSDYATWAASMKDIFGPRGFDGMGMGGGETVISLCQPSNPLVNTLRGGGFGPARILRAGGFGNPFPYPDPDTSWLYFTNDLVAQRLDETVELKALPPREIDIHTLRSIPTPQPKTVVLRGGGVGGPPQTVTLRAGGIGSDLGSPQAPGLGITTGAPEAGASATDPANPNDFGVGYDQITDLPLPDAEVRAAPSFYVWMVGQAIRAGYSIAPPDLASVSGLLAVPANDERCYSRVGVRADWMGVPIIKASWVTRWLVLGIPANIGIPGSPMP